jgi:undecaprenyl-diphosphatase
MSMFQAVLHAVVHGFTEFLPVSASAHHALLAYLFSWSPPGPAMHGVLALGALLALLVYFRHDWASIISGFLGVILFRKKPMTLDERLPLFIFAATVPLAAAWHASEERFAELAGNPPLIAALLVGFAIPLWLVDRASRKSKGMFDWNGLDSAVVGIFQALSLIPGAGRSALSITGALARGYRRDAAVKFSLFAAAPILGASAFLGLREVAWGTGMPAPDLSWLSFWVALVVSLFASLLGIGGLVKHVVRGGMGHYVVYRVLLAAAVAVVWWTRG